MPHVHHAYFSSFIQSNNCFVVLTQPELSSLLNSPQPAKCVISNFLFFFVSLTQNNHHFQWHFRSFSFQIGCLLQKGCKGAGTLFSLLGEECSFCFFSWLDIINQNRKWRSLIFNWFETSQRSSLIWQAGQILVRNDFFPATRSQRDCTIDSLVFVLSVIQTWQKSTGEDLIGSNFLM